MKTIKLFVTNITDEGVRVEDTRLGKIELYLKMSDEQIKHNLLALKLAQGETRGRPKLKVINE